MVHAEYTGLEKVTVMESWSYSKNTRIYFLPDLILHLQEDSFMAVLRYIAFLSDDPEKTSEFYRRFLGTEELGRSGDGDISITDGFYNLTFFKRRAQLNEMKMECGLHHIGLAVDDLEEGAGSHRQSARQEDRGNSRSAQRRFRATQGGRGAEARV